MPAVLAQQRSQSKRGQSSHSDPQEGEGDRCLLCQATISTQTAKGFFQALLPTFPWYSPQKMLQGMVPAGNRDWSSVLLWEKTPVIINSESASIHPKERSWAQKTTFKLIRDYLPINYNLVLSNASESLGALLFCFWKLLICRLCNLFQTWLLKFIMQKLNCQEFKLLRVVWKALFWY